MRESPEVERLTPGWVADAFLRMLFVTWPNVIIALWVELGITLSSNYDSSSHVGWSVLRVGSIVGVPWVCGLVSLASSSGPCERRLRRATWVSVATSALVLGTGCLWLSATS